MFIWDISIDINSEGAASYGICFLALPRRFLGRFGTQPMILTEKRWYCIQYVCVYIYMHTHVSIYLHMEAQDALKKVIQQKPMVFNLFVQKWIFTVPAHILQIHHVGCCAHFFPSCAVILSHYSIARWFQNLKLKMWKGGEQAPKKFPYAARKSAFTRCSVRGKECDFGMLADVGRYPLVN